MSKNISRDNARLDFPARFLFNFLINHGRVIFFSSTLGLLGSIIFLGLYPSQYEATAQIKLAQIEPYTKNLGNSSLNVSVEDSNALIARMKLASFYSSTEMEACLPPGKLSSARSILDDITFFPLRGVTGVVLLKVRSSSMDLAYSCAEAIFKKIQISQFEDIERNIAEAESLIKRYQDRLKKLSTEFDANYSSIASPGYVNNQYEVKVIMNEIFNLNTFIVSANFRKARLSAPIDTSAPEITPNKYLTLIVGIILGLFFGVCYVALFKKIHI